MGQAHLRATACFRPYLYSAQVLRKITSPIATHCSSAEKQLVARWNGLAREPRVGKVRCRGRVLGSWEIHLGDGGDQRWSDLHPRVAGTQKRVWWAGSALCWSKFATRSPAREFDMRLLKNGWKAPPQSSCISPSLQKVHTCAFPGDSNPSCKITVLISVVSPWISFTWLWSFWATCCW